MPTNPAIRQITDRGIENARARVAITSPTLADGSDNPCHAQAIADLTELQKHYDAKCQVVALAAKEGFRRNTYAGKCCQSGAEVKEGAGFIRRNEKGKWQTYSFSEVVEITGFIFEGAT